MVIPDQSGQLLALRLAISSRFRHTPFHDEKQTPTNDPHPVCHHLGSTGVPVYVHPPDPSRFPLVRGLVHRCRPGDLQIKRMEIRPAITQRSGQLLVARNSGFGYNPSIRTVRGWTLDLGVGFRGPIPSSRINGTRQEGTSTPKPLEALQSSPFD